MCLRATSFVCCGILLALLSNVCLLGANPRPTVAELEQRLQTATPAERPALLVELSTAIEANDMRRAEEYARQARAEANSAADTIRADGRIASLTRRRGQYTEALELAQSALARATELKLDELRAELLLVIGMTYTSLADFPAALAALQELLPLAEHQGDPLFLARVHNTFGVSYIDGGQPANARTSFEASLRYAEEAGDRRMVASILNNLGNLAIEARDLPRARREHEAALAVRESLGGDARGIANSNQNLGEICILEGKPAEALAHLDLAIALHTPLGLDRNITNAQLNAAIALQALGRMEEAAQRLEIARTLAEKINSPTITARVHRGLARYHEARGDFQAALQHERARAQAEEAAVGERSRQRVDLLQARFNAVRRQHEIDVLRRDQAINSAKLERVRLQRYGLAALAVFGFVALAATVSRYQVKRRAEKLILEEATAARAVAEEASALKSEIVRMVSHDLRSPIGNIRSMAEDIQRAPQLSPDDVRLRVIAHEADHVLGLAQDLLDNAALEAGRLDIERNPVDVSAVVRSTLGRVALSVDAKRQRVEFAAPSPGEAIVQGDANRLGQVFANLLTNASKYSPPGSAIDVRIERRDGRVRVSVRDVGRGIAAEDIPEIFKPFSRTKAKAAGAESSYGIGLSIARHLVHLHEGRIDVDSAPGRGSTFVVDLPAHT